jgi:hypothetical protein
MIFPVWVRNSSMMSPKRRPWTFPNRQITRYQVPASDLAKASDAQWTASYWKGVRLTADQTLRRLVPWPEHKILQSLAEGCGFLVCRGMCRHTFPLHSNVGRRVTVQSCAHNLQLRMLVLHRCLHVSVAHRSHDGCQVSRSHENSCAVVMSCTIKHQILWETGLPAGLAKPMPD